MFWQSLSFKIISYLVKATRNKEGSLDLQFAEELQLLNAAKGHGASFSNFLISLYLLEEWEKHFDQPLELSIVKS